MTNKQRSMTNKQRSVAGSVAGIIFKETGQKYADAFNYGWFMHGVGHTLEHTSYYRDRNRYPSTHNKGIVDGWKERQKAFPNKYFSQ